ncbi:TIGR01777 family oxidoreductase [Dongia sp.]|uniref:TIGR01777 family oxidoreductase n=1 Tax=Dongia sp. TaxID=1977262 RepID=UPI0037511349
MTGRLLERRTVLVTGATGFIGRALVARLHERGDRVVVLAREAVEAHLALGTEVLVTTRLTDLPPAFPIDAVVNLAGAPIMAGAWTKERKRRLVGSRVGVTRLLVDWLATRSRRPEVLVSASAIGWYGAGCDAAFAPAGEGFAAVLCRAWEREAASAAALGMRVCRLRLGLVLGPEGGMLKSLLPAFRLGFGAVIGDGQQWLSWIHRDDAVEMIARAIADPLFSGAINATAPLPVRQAEFAHTLGRVLHRPVWLSLPAAPLRALLGERASLLLEGPQVLPKRALEIGFAFRCPELEPALRDLLVPESHHRGATVRLLDDLLT